MSDEEHEAEEYQVTPKPRELGDAYRFQVTNFINEKAASENDACPVCASPRNFVTDTPYQLAVQSDPPAPFNTVMMPIIATVCVNCGFVRLFNENVIRDQIGDQEPELPLTAPPAEVANGG